MSIKVSTWVWERSKHRGTQKLLLLALAEFANDSGICWPSVDTLSKRIGESDRHTRQLIQKLVASGDLLLVTGGGRGNTTRYAIAVGLSDKQRDKLNTVLHNSVSQNSVLQNTDIPGNPEVQDRDHEKTLNSGDINPDLQRQETLNSGDLAEEPSTAPQPTKTARKAQEIRHVDPSIDPPTATQSARASPHQDLIDAYADRLGYPIPHGGKEAAAARKILKAGYTIAQACECYDRIKTQTRWADRHLSLQIVYEEIGAGLTAREHSNGRHEEKRNRVVSGGAGGEPSGDAANAAALERSGQRAERAPLRRASIDY